MVGICAGVITITGSVVSLAGFHGRPPAFGEMVAVVQDARELAPLADATVEILTPQDALVTTLTAPGDGRVARRLKEGKYRVRVSHPRFAALVRQIEVSSGETSELRVSLLPRPAPPVATAAPAPLPVPVAPPVKYAPAVKAAPVPAPQHARKLSEPAKKPAAPAIVVAKPQRNESP
jgi:hypothetical protein